MRRVDSSEGVALAVHDLGGRGTPLLIAHATGFNGHSYVPMADALAGRFRSFALDFRGHGDTAAPDGWPDGRRVDWGRYGDDAWSAARAVAPNVALVGFGHSMGASALLMAAHRDPALFASIVAFEPIGSPGPPRPEDRPPELLTTMVDTARRRRRTFPSFEEAIEHFGSKPPMAAFAPEALRGYVEHGFTATGAGVTLRCDPELEAQTFLNGSANGLWDLLPEIGTRVVVVIGEALEVGPSSLGEALAARLPNGSLRSLPHLDHFAPFTHPVELAELVAQVAESGARG